MILKHVFTYSAILNEPLFIGRNYAGVREVFTVKDGYVWGPEFQGRVLPVGGEFQVTDSDGLIHMDVRIVLEIDDDSSRIYMQYKGLADISSSVMDTVRTKGSTNFGDFYFVTQPVLESGSESYAWVGRSVFVAEGRISSSDTVEYRVYQCIPSE